MTYGYGIDPSSSQMFLSSWAKGDRMEPDMIICVFYSVRVVKKEILAMPSAGDTQQARALELKKMLTRGIFIPVWKFCLIPSFFILNRSSVPQLEKRSPKVPVWCSSTDVGSNHVAV